MEQVDPGPADSRVSRLLPLVNRLDLKHKLGPLLLWNALNEFLVLENDFVEVSPVEVSLCIYWPCLERSVVLHFFIKANKDDPQSSNLSRQLPSKINGED